MGDLRNTIPGIDQSVVAGGKIFTRMGKGPLAPALCFGSGVPTLKAPKGSLYLRTDGSSTSTRQYIATDAVGGWTASTTAA